MTHQEQMNQIGEVMDRLASLDFYQDDNGNYPINEMEWRNSGGCKYELLRVIFYTSFVEVEVHEFTHLRDPESNEFKYSLGWDNNLIEFVKGLL